jgi:hypothetical protein
MREILKLKLSGWGTLKAWLITKSALAKLRGERFNASWFSLCMLDKRKISNIDLHVIEWGVKAFFGA